MSTETFIGGSISDGTLRAVDLIPCFLDELDRVAPAAYAQLIALPFPLVPAWVDDEGPTSEWWEGEEAADVLRILFDALEENAPEGFMFGAHPDDGASFGWWELDS